MIPRIIHCCWFGGKEMPNDVLRYIDTWKALNPDFEVKVWGEDNFDLSSNRYAREAYESKKWAFVTDYVRLKVLYDYGGIYMDTDVEVLKPLDSLLENKAFSGFEGDDRIPTGTMGAEKGNPWIGRLLKYYDDRSFYLESGELDLTTNVVTITNITKEYYPIVLNNTYQNLGDVTFYPFDYLCAKDLVDGVIYATKNTITVHHFNGSWIISPKVKFIKLLKKVFGQKFVDTIVRFKHSVQGRNAR